MNKSERRLTGIRCAAGIAALVLGVSTSIRPELSVVLILSALLLALLVARPVLLPVLLVVVVSSIANWDALPSVELYGVRVYTPEAILVAGAIAVGLLIRQDPKPFTQVAVRVPVLLIGLFLLGAVTGIVIGSPAAGGIVAAVRRSSVAWFYLCVPLFAYVLLDRQRRMTVGKAVVSIGLLTVAAQVLQLSLGPSFPLIAVGGNQSLVSLDPGSGLLRVRPPGLTLVFFLSFYCWAYMIFGPRRYRSLVFVLLVILGVGVILSLNRNMLLSMVVSVLGVAAVLGRRGIASGVLLLITSALLVLTIWPGHVVPSNPVLARAASLFHVDQLMSQDLSDRLEESALALSTLSKRPLSGVGWGADYGARTWTLVNGRTQLVVREWIHNQYLWLWLRTGAIGLVGFGGALVTSWCCCRKVAARTQDVTARWLSAGTMMCLSAIAISAFVGLYFSAYDSAVPLALVLGLSLVLFEEFRAAGSDEQCLTLS